MLPTFVGLFRGRVDQWWEWWEVEDPREDAAGLFKALEV